MVKMKKHIGLVAIRLLFAFLISKALAFSHVNWGEAYPGDGQKAFGFVVAFALIGIAVAVVYLVVGCIMHAVLRNKTMRTVLLVDVIMALTLISILALCGVNAHYDNAQSNQQVEGLRN